MTTIVNDYCYYGYYFITTIINWYCTHILTTLPYASVVAPNGRTGSWTSRYTTTRALSKPHCQHQQQTITAVSTAGHNLTVAVFREKKQDGFCHCYKAVLQLYVVPQWKLLNNNHNNNNRFTALCLGLPGWASTRRNTHPPTILIIIQSLSAVL